eukprot:CAMPEP_0115842920 /NCGR_PEP_ID=MMETSP0287-20121206/8047_1 /TAXON_ID=412157 /ORGANISM="Chrysochromulina rotalis, Strain UIO044" /LENGTH=296 /DNA_ID=CAMNT_0003296601 /DNA_START=41 /DNA_END=931 /DNA_ORIENTATION=+
MTSQENAQRQFPTSDGLLAAKQTAACLVGEVRALIYPQVLAMLRRNVLDSLDADTFFVYTRTWSQWQISPANATGPDRSSKLGIYVRAGFDRIPSQVSLEQIAAITSELRPIASEETKDAEVIRRDDGRRGWLPVPIHKLANTSLCADGRGANPYDATCLFALRCTRCFQLIERAEKRRGFLYTWVLRARPDVFVGCRWQLPASVNLRNGSNSEWAAYAWDYLAFMPRAVAESSLGDGYRASFSLKSGAVCQRGSTGGTIGCNPCWLKARRGLDLLFLDGRTFGFIDIARQVCSVA